MREIEEFEKSRQQDLLRWAAVSLIVAVVLVLVAAIVQVTSGTYSGVPGRNRLELVSREGANAVTAAFVLAAVIALAFLTPERITRARPVVVITLIVGTVVALLATFSIIDVLTVHIPGPNSNDVASIGIVQGQAFSERLSAMLPQLAALVIVVVALVAGNRLGGSPDAFSGSRESGADLPG